MSDLIDSLHAVRRMALTLKIFIFCLAAPCFASYPTISPWDSFSKMRPLIIGAMTLRTAEYWVFQGNLPFRYPDDVIRGFYPAEIEEETILCAEQGFEQVKAYLKSAPEELTRAVQLGVTRSVVLSVNDYRFASHDRVLRNPRLSHWGLDRDLSSGFWRWEITLSQEGTCMLPRIQTIRETFRLVADHPKISPPARRRALPQQSPDPRRF